MAAAVVLALVVAIGAVFTIVFQGGQYSARALVVLKVAATDGAPNPGFDAGAGQLAASRIESYSVLTGSESFLWRTIEGHHLPLTPDELRAATTVSSPKDSTLLEVAIRLDDPQLAVRAATAMGQELAEAITEIEKPSTVHSFVSAPARATPAFPGAVLRSVCSPLWPWRLSLASPPPHCGAGGRLRIGRLGALPTVVGSTATTHEGIQYETT